MGLLDGLHRGGGDDEAELVRAIQEAAAGQTPDRVKAVTQALCRADAYLLSAGGSPTSPNARTLSRQGHVWTIAFSSAARAIRARKGDDGILRAPMSIVCTVAVKTGQAGVFLNPGDNPWLLITGPLLREVAAGKGSSRDIVMIDPGHASSLLVEVAPDGSITVEGRQRTLPELRQDLEALSKRNGVVHYTRDQPEAEPSGPAWTAGQQVLAVVTELRLPVSFVQRGPAGRERGGL
jgi:hypothetical protein